MSGDQVVARLRDGTPVAAWLLKANPAVWDVGSFLRSGEPLHDWRLAPTYRVGLIGPGHPVALWVTRGDPGHPAGVWGMGRVVGDPADDVGEPGDRRWRDLAARDRVRPYVPVELSVLAEPVLLEHLREDPRFAGAEIVRAPRVASPVALTATQWAAVEDLAVGGRLE